MTTPTESERARDGILAHGSNSDADRFKRTLVRVMTVQVATLLLLWILQAAFTH